MSIRKYTVNRIDVDYYTVQEEELILRRKIKRGKNGEFYYEDYTAWEFISSIGGQFPELDIPQEAQKRNPRTPLRKNGDSYVFYACVEYFPSPRLAGKWRDYTTAYGFNEK